MGQLTVAQYDTLERAVADGSRIAVLRRGTEFIFVPLQLNARGGRETIEAKNPATGDAITLYLDEIDDIEVVS